MCDCGWQSITQLTTRPAAGANNKINYCFYCQFIIKEMATHNATFYGFELRVYLCSQSMSVQPPKKPKPNLKARCEITGEMR